jgi:hypothetical protein
MACDSSASLSSSEDAFSWSNPRGFESPRYQRSIISFFAFVCISGMCGGVGVALGLFLGPAKEIDDAGT